MQNTKREIRISDLQHSLEFIKQFKAMNYVFRGISDTNYKLETTYDRSFAKGRGKEAYIMNEFKRKLHHYLRPNEMPENIFELLALMQHYGAPTRLLDFTRSYYVALYFACRDSNEKDGAIYSIMLPNLLSYGLSQLRSRNFPLSLNMEGLLPDHTFQDSFRSNDYFQEAILSDKYGFILALEPYKLNDRISKQQGLFLINSSSMFSFEDTLFNLMKVDKDEVIKDSHNITLEKIIIPSNLKKDIMKELFEMNINAETLFGGLDGFARSLKDKVDSIYNSSFDSKFTPNWYKDL